MWKTACLRARLGTAPGPGQVFLLILLAFFLCTIAAASPEYGIRRQTLRKALPPAVIVLFGNAAGPDDEFASYEQEPNFYYLTGWKEQGAVLLIDPRREVLFLPRHDARREKMWGPQAGPDDAGVRERSGFATVLPVDRLEAELRGSLQRWELLYLMPPQERSLTVAARQRNGFLGLPLPGAVRMADVQPELTRLRMKKSPEEIELIQHAVDATVTAHLAAWKDVAPGKYEYQVAVRMQSVYLDQGCERNAYPPIVASGPNALYLHYDRIDRRIGTGELLLMDVGAECAGYAADVTRTIPVSGKFSARQREIYDIVLGAQKAVIAAVRPGMTIGRDTPRSLYRIAYEYLNSHGKDLHGGSLGKYFVHGISHHIGLEVHDPGDLDAPLEAGMVISVEPGLYIPEEQIGVRIEDMVLVTDDGARVLTAALPREAAEIEKALVR